MRSEEERPVSVVERCMKRERRLRGRCLWAAALIAVALCGAADRFGRAQEMGPEIYHTAVNIWYTDPRQIPTTNYHVGEMIPVGTRVTLEKIGGISIVFSTDDKKTFTILHMVRHSTLKLEEEFARFFATKDALAPGGAFHGFTKEEQKGIAEGTIYEGMRRSAVLMAYGYPPSHKTPDLAANTWTYWVSRRRTATVTFNDEDKVESVKGLPRPAPEKDTKE